MPNLGAPEIIVIVVVLVLLLGWKKLPDAARSVGRSMRIFKSEVSEMKTDGKSAASSDTVDGETSHPTTAAPQAAPQTTPQGTAPIQENAPKTDNTSGPTGTGSSQA